MGGIVGKRGPSRGALLFRGDPASLDNHLRTFTPLPSDIGSSATFTYPGYTPPRRLHIFAVTTGWAQYGNTPTTAPTSTQPSLLILGTPLSSIARIYTGTCPASALAHAPFWDVNKGVACPPAFAFPSPFRGPTNPADVVTQPSATSLGFCKLPVGYFPLRGGPSYNPWAGAYMPSDVNFAAIVDAGTYTITARVVDQAGVQVGTPATGTVTFATPVLLQAIGSVRPSSYTNVMDYYRGMPAFYGMNTLLLDITPLPLVAPGLHGSSQLSVIFQEESLDPNAYYFGVSPNYFSNPRITISSFPRPVAGVAVSADLAPFVHAGSFACNAYISVGYPSAPMRISYTAFYFYRSYPPTTLRSYSPPLSVAISDLSPTTGVFNMRFWDYYTGGSRLIDHISIAGRPYPPQSWFPVSYPDTNRLSFDFSGGWLRSVSVWEVLP